MFKYMYLIPASKDYYFILLAVYTRKYLFYTKKYSILKGIVHQVLNVNMVNIKF